MVVRESSVVAAICRELHARGCLFWNIHGSIYSRGGTPDLIGCAPGGVFFALEVKTSAGVASKLQLRAIGKIREGGGRAGVVRSVAEAVEVVFG